MPANIKTKRASPRIRKGTFKRSNRPAAGCKRSAGPQKDHSRIIGNSIFALTLKKKPGLEVVSKVESKKYRIDDEDDFYKMYADLLACYHQAMKITGQPTKYDPFGSGLEIGVSLSSIVKSFKENVAPKDANVNIDYNVDDGYYFTVYRYAPFDCYWHAFEVKPIVKKIKNDPQLHKLFIEYIKAFMNYTGIDGWWNGGMGFADYMLEEKIDNWENEMGEEFEDKKELNKAMADLKNYKNGIAHEYKNIITRAASIAPEQLIKKILPYKRSRIGKLMLAGCEFMKYPGTQSDFIYYEMEHNGDVEGLRFDQQAAIIWDWDDYYTDMQEECLDAEANGCGIVEPILNYSFKKSLNEFSKEEFERRLKWPAELTRIFTQHNAYADSLKPTKKNKRAK
jgi:hypothetical protein